MNTWNPQANEIFLHALGLGSAAERREYIDAACAGDESLWADVEALLAAGDNAGSFLESPAVARELAATLDRPIVERPGTVIGRYKLLEQIGEGGFGIVFMAEQQEPVRRKVALKVLRPGMDTRQVVARFEAERQALALMDHAHIAHVFDGGTTATGRPYFVMDLVKGIPITEYCDQNQITTRERLELFVQICEAVQHAHQKGIIHRDIKPSNVLISRHDGTPVVKVIDFGIAKALGQQLTEKTLFTNFAQLIGTPLYMSPEQAGMSDLDVDTRSDIYSLGVLLYELLTGTTPFDAQRFKNAGFDEMRRIIREEEPPKPSTRVSTVGKAAETVFANRKSDPKQLSRLFRGELDWIVMKALEKDRNRRYETANSLALDVQRYLRDEPVLACPPSAWYRFGKFARRKKTALAMAACVFLTLSAVAGGGGWLVRDRLARQWDSEAKADETLKAMEPRLREGQPGDAALAAAALRVEAWIEGDTLGADACQRGQQFLRDVRMVDEISKIRLRPAESTGGQMWDWAAAEKQYAAAFKEYGLDLFAIDSRQATSRIRDSVIRETLLAGLDSWMQIMSVHNQNRDRLRAVADGADDNPWRRAFREAALAGDTKKLEASAGEAGVPTQPPGVVAWLGSLLADAGLPREAEGILRQAQERHSGDFWVNYNLGHFLIFGPLPHRADEAVGYFRAAVAIRPTSAEARSILGLALTLQEDFDGAITALRQAIALDAEFTQARVNLGDALWKKGRLDESIAVYREAVDIAPDICEGRFRLANALKHNGQRDKAIDEYRETHRRHQDFAEARDELAMALKNRAVAYNKSGQFESAIDDLSEALELDPNDWQAMDFQAWAYTGLGQWDKVLAISDKVIEINPEAWQPWNTRAGFYRNAGQWDRALADSSKAIELEPQAWLPWAGRGMAYVRLKKYGPGLADYNKAIELQPDNEEVWQWRSSAFLDIDQYDNALADDAKAIEILRGRVKSNKVAAEPYPRIKLGHGLWHLARVLSLASRYAEAEKTQREALQIFEELASEYQHERFYRREAAFSMRFLAEIARNTGRADEAIDRMLHAIDLYAGLMAEKPHSNFYRLELAFTYAQLGSLYGNVEHSAEDAFRKALEIYWKMIGETPLEPGLPARLVNVCRDLSGTLQKAGRVQEAQELCRRALQESRSAVVRERETFNPRKASRGYWELAIALESCAQLTNLLGDVETAERTYSDANDIWRELVTEYNFEDYRFHLGVNDDTIGAFLRQHGRADEVQDFYRAARAIWEKLVAEFNEEDRRTHLAWTNQSLGELAEGLGRLDDAAAAYRQAAEIWSTLAAEFPRNSEFGERYHHCLLALAKVYAKQGKAEEADQVVTKGVGPPRPDDLNWLLQRGHMLDALGRAEEARAAFNRAFSLAPDDLMIRVEALPDISREDAYAQQLSALCAFVKEHPSQPPAARLALASRLFPWAERQAKAGHVQVAADAFADAASGYDHVLTEIASRPESATDLGVPATAENIAWYRHELGYVLVWHGNVLSHLGQLAEAERALCRGLEVHESLVFDAADRTDYKARLVWNQVQLADVRTARGDRPGAERAYRDAIACVEDGRFYDRNVAKLYERLAELYRQGGRPGEAVETRRKAVAAMENLDPEARSDDHRARLAENNAALGQLLWQMGDRQEAVAAYRKARDFWEALMHNQPDDAPLHNNLAWLYATCPETGVRDAEQAVALASKAVELKPAEGTAWNTLGAAHYRAGDWPEAIEALNKSMELRNGGDACDWFFLAMSRWQQGDREQARKLYTQAIEWMAKNQPNDEELHRFRDEAAELMGVNATGPQTPPAETNLK